MQNLQETLNSKWTFSNRHIGPSENDQRQMLKTLGLESLEELSKKTIPENIQNFSPMGLGKGLSEFEALHELRLKAKKNKIFKSWIGSGYRNVITPSPISRNIFENPGWYTQYTPYQAEISQGRLEALLNFQTMICDLTGLPVANASLLDEGTAAAEAMVMMSNIKNKDQSRFFLVDSQCHPQTIEVVKTRAKALKISIIIADPAKFGFESSIFGALIQYPGTQGEVIDWTYFIDKAHGNDALVALAGDVMSLVLLKSPGAMGADIALGTSQNFGVPIGFGGPHAAYFATKKEYLRGMPGRIVGVSVNREGKKAYRLSLQTREQHIRREKATSNICTAQALLASMASMYAVYHGPEGLKEIARKIQGSTELWVYAMRAAGFQILNTNFFDTVAIKLSPSRLQEVLSEAKQQSINLRVIDPETLAVSFDETTKISDIEVLLSLFDKKTKLHDFMSRASSLDKSLLRQDQVLTHPVFSQYHSETELLRYIKRLESRDLSLTHSMIPLGSCTMKLNAASELYPVSWPEFSSLHPGVPKDQYQGYLEMLSELEEMLCKVTGFDAVSLQPNSGAQGEYAGLLVIMKYHESRKESFRNVCLIPSSAHGTNPASAALAGMKVVVTKCDADGNVDVVDLKLKVEENRSHLAALMVTYPSTHGVFEQEIRDICKIVHDGGGLVYMDGANLNAQLGLCKGGEFGPDVCHMNLHKTFCIPHGGGGPGMGPIAVTSRLRDFLPQHTFAETGGSQAIGPVSSAPWGSASILPISWMYIRMMGDEGLKAATQVAILNANYMAHRLDPYFPVLYRGKSGLVAHECIVDLRQFKATAGVEVEDVAKRLMDYGFHAPTVSFPVPGTLMIEPTESENKIQLDRFIEAMIGIRHEIDGILSGKYTKESNPLKNAPHTSAAVTAATWDHAYSREEAAFPAPWIREAKFWPFTSRIDGAFGDRNPVCTCPPIESYGD